MAETQYVQTQEDSYYDRINKFQQRLYILESLPESFRDANWIASVTRCNDEITALIIKINALYA